jgi:acyl dehydratase
VSEAKRSELAGATSDAGRTGSPGPTDGFGGRPKAAARSECDAEAMFDTDSPMTTEFASPRALLDAVGTDLGATDWITITQDQIDQFAEATLDNQWIHVNTERAKAGPFGGPIAHGYLTMSLAAYVLGQLVRVSGISMGINYGADKVRFPSPVPVGSKLRGRGELLDAKEVPGGVQATTRITVEREGGDKPAAVVDTVSRYLT